MSFDASLIATKTGIRDQLDGMILRGRSPKSFLANVAYPLYISRQSKRWMTEGRSEEKPWAPLNAKYKEWKRINFAGYPGDGQKMLIRTGKLFEAVVGRELKGQATEITYEMAGGKMKPVLGGSLKEAGLQHHFAKVTDSQLHVYTDLDYAKKVNEARNIWFFSEDFKKRIRAAYKGWYVRGSVKFT